MLNSHEFIKKKKKRKKKGNAPCFGHLYVYFGHSGFGKSVTWGTDSLYKLDREKKKVFWPPGCQQHIVRTWSPYFGFLDVLLCPEALSNLTEAALVREPTEVTTHVFSTPRVVSHVLTNYFGGTKLMFSTECIQHTHIKSKLL